jgi:predicted nucleotide-binding protein
MTLTAKTATARNAIRTQLGELLALVRHAQQSRDFQTGFERLKRWKHRTVNVLRRDVHTNEGDRLESKEKRSFRIGDPIGNLVDEAGMYAGFLEALDQELAEHSGDILEVATPAEGAREEIDIPAPPATGAVFIVHGRDELNLLRLKELIRDRWRLEPIVLAAKPGKGRTLIEKFEDEAQRAAFAFVLLTPDDVVETESGSYAQPRPNVVFELGWFYGRLSRSRVCILFKKGTRIHSDLDGISRVQFAESVDEAVDEIERELVEASVLKRS